MLDAMSTNIVEVDIHLVRTQKVSVTERVQAKRDALVAAGKCTGCEQVIAEPQRARCGQCSTCYQRTRAAIRSGHVTLQEIIKAGKILPPRRGGRPTTNSYANWLAENK